MRVKEKFWTQEDIQISRGVMTQLSVTARPAHKTLVDTAVCIRFSKFSSSIL